MLAVTGPALLPMGSDSDLSPTCHRVLAGFSLVELMTVLAVACVLLSVAVPGFVSLIGRTRVGTAAGDFLTAIKAARSEALGRGVRIDMVPNDGTNWTSGWTVFVDDDGDLSLDKKESIILHRPALPQDVRVATGNGAGAGFRDAKEGRTYLAFNGAGYPKDNSGASAMDSLILHNDYAKRKIILSFLGRARSCDPDRDKDC